MSDTRAWVPDEAVAELVVRRATRADEDPIGMANDILKESIPVVTMSMVHLAIHSPTESVRFNAAKYVMDRTMGKADEGLSAEVRPAWESIYEAVLEEANTIKDSE